MPTMVWAGGMRIFNFDWHKLDSNSDLVHVMVQACIGKIILIKDHRNRKQRNKGDHLHLYPNC